MFIITKRQTEKTASQFHIDKFFGSIDDEEAASMMSAVEECRRIEPNEW